MKYMTWKIIAVCVVFGAYFLYNPASDLVYRMVSGDQGPIQYCFAFWAPHGGYWQDNCYDSRAECNKNLAQRIEISPNVNTKSCYRLERIEAYCLGGVLTGHTRHDDFDNTPYEVKTEICTRTEKQCQEFIKYRDPGLAGKHIGCEKTIVATREGEGSYLSSRAELDSIIKNNAERMAKDQAGANDGTTCVQYRAATDQQRAFTDLGLDWERTNKWGAFVDVDGALRANKPSCREIKRGSAEYAKYLK